MHHIYVPVCELIISVETENTREEKYSTTRNIVDNVEESPLNASLSVACELFVNL